MESLSTIFLDSTSPIIFDPISNSSTEIDLPGVMQPKIDERLPGGEEVFEEDLSAQNCEKFCVTQLESILKINVNQLEQFLEIEDYAKTKKSRPYCVIAEGKYFILDGWSMVEAARKNGITEIECFATTVSKYDPEDMALRKVAYRIKPEGGRARYVENVRNIKKIITNMRRRYDN